MSTPHRNTQMRNLETLAVMQWKHLGVAARYGLAYEYELTRDVCAALHGARMVLSGRAASTASFLYDIAWLRSMQLARQLDDARQPLTEAA